MVNFGRDCPLADTYAQLRVAASWLNDLVANSDHHSLGAGHCTKLWTKMLDVFFDCSAADVKHLANLPR